METQEEAGWGQLGRWAGIPALSMSWLLLGCLWSPTELTTLRYL